ncbi:MAG: response regulator [bacterium]|nr:response regulator [bacterium]
MVVDDEPLARDRIRDLLEDETEFDVIGESCNGLEAVKHITEKQPDLIFLDVQMPEMDGFEVLDTIYKENMPHVIFITAYDQYALRAFEVHALDYLLKPFDQKRFKKSIIRAKEQIDQIKNNTITTRFKELLHELKTSQKFLERLVIKSEGRIFFVKTEEISWIEAAGNYVTVHVNGEEHLIRDTMNCMERKLDPEKFIRIHRSRIVNIEHIKEIQPFYNGENLIILNSGTELTLSRKYREKLKELFSYSF